MENARIAVFEDSKVIRHLLKQVVEKNGHSVIAEAAELHTAVEVVNTYDFDVAIVDGNLDTDRIDCSDGKDIISELRSKRPETAIIWFSSIPAETVHADYDADAGKDAFTALDAINKL